MRLEVNSRSAVITFTVDELDWLVTRARREQRSDAVAVEIDLSNLSSGALRLVELLGRDGEQ